MIWDHSTQDSLHLRKKITASKSYQRHSSANITSTEIIKKFQELESKESGLPLYFYQDVYNIK